MGNVGRGMRMRWECRNANVQVDVNVRVRSESARGLWPSRRRCSRHEVVVLVIVSPDVEMLLVLEPHGFVVYSGGAVSL